MSKFSLITTCCADTENDSTTPATWNDLPSVGNLTAHTRASVVHHHIYHKSVETDSDERNWSVVVEVDDSLKAGGRGRSVDPERGHECSDTSEANVSRISKSVDSLKTQSQQTLQDGLKKDRFKDLKSRGLGSLRTRREWVRRQTRSILGVSLRSKFKETRYPAQNFKFPSEIKKSHNKIQHRVKPELKNYADTELKRKAKTKYDVEASHDNKAHFNDVSRYYIQYDDGDNRCDSGEQLRNLPYKEYFVDGSDVVHQHLSVLNRGGLEKVAATSCTTDDTHYAVANESHCLSVSHIMNHTSIVDTDVSRYSKPSQRNYTNDERSRGYHQSSNGREFVEISQVLERKMTSEMKEFRHKEMELINKGAELSDIRLASKTMIDKQIVTQKNLCESSEESTSREFSQTYSRCSTSVSIFTELVLIDLSHLPYPRYLGLVLRGQCTPDGNEDNGIVVKDVKPHCPAGIDGRIKPGDVILEVNGIDLEPLSNSIAIEVLEQEIKSCDSVELQLGRYYVDPPSRLRAALEASSIPTEGNSSSSSSASTVRLNPLDSSLNFAGMELVDWVQRNIDGLNDRGDALAYVAELCENGYIRAIDGNGCVRDIVEFSESDWFTFADTGDQQFDQTLLQSANDDLQVIAIC